MDAHLKACINTITHRMFVDTADKNYILARLAFINKFDLDFFWLVLHAFEKYCKAILLLNGKSSIGYSHKIIKLLHDVRALDSRISFQDFDRPSGFPEDVWHAETFDKWIERLAKRGDPDNRYMTGGYSLRTDDLVKADHAVWSIRRYCRPFIQEINTGKEIRKFDHLASLAANPQRWKLGFGSLLERGIREQLDSPIFEAFAFLNFSFCPDLDHKIEAWRSSFSHSPFSEFIHIATEAEKDSGSEASAKAVLSWALANIKFSAEDKNFLKQVIFKPKP